MANAASDSLFRQADQLLAQNPPDYGQALPLLQQAARQGHAEAAFQLAGIFLEQSEPDIEAAIPWLEIAAKQNHPYAVYNLLHLRERAGEPFSAFLSEYAWLGERGILANTMPTTTNRRPSIGHAKPPDKATRSGNTSSPNTTTSPAKPT